MASPGVWIGLECGGTRTVVLAAGPSGQLLRRLEAGPANLRLMQDPQLEAHFRALADQLPPPSGLGVGMAGVRDRADCLRVERVLERIWPGVPRRVDHDLESALAAADGQWIAGAEGIPVVARVIVLSGTGSCCYGRHRSGRTAKVGGWGHLLGDRGSAYDIAFRALRGAVHVLDHTGVWGRFGRQALRALALNEPNDLIAWLQAAGKTEIAALAPEVFAAAMEGDRGARRVLSDTADGLAEDALACARHLVPGPGPVQFVFTGSVLLKQPGFARQVAARIRSGRRSAMVWRLPRESAWGAVAMAREAWTTSRAGTTGCLPSGPLRTPATAPASPVWIPGSCKPSPTEGRNPRSMSLDRMSIEDALLLLLAEEGRGVVAVRRQRGAMARLVRRVIRTFRSGGRLFYVGAGTSGRLGVLDASECPPTFRTPPDQVQGIMAGGVRALHTAVEGAEDDAAAGARAVAHRDVESRDLVIGLAASGRTPFVWGALAEARHRTAGTALVCFNPHLDFRGGWTPDVVVAVDSGPEVLTGSTRLKAGTGTKLILNAVTTLAMVRLGKVVGNLMVDLNPSNEKLRDRACRIVTTLAGVPPEAARATLEHSGWQVKSALARVRPARRGR
ncbi:MAG: N-acetylmuramic acid 6-phosphate etherase [Verrucomicrobia bacterium]|nr:N-acetylmuramic acid 6-phosphate etherase [Verrucomicrobiota bacterium]